jgi:hypothetical protein
MRRFTHTLELAGTLVVLLAFAALATACGPPIKNGGRPSLDVPQDKFGAPVSHLTNRCPRGAGDGKVQLSWKDTGHTRIKGKCEGGLMVGTWKATFEFGRKQWKAELVQGRIEGTFKAWFGNGEKMAKAHYKNGILNGKFKSWWPNGELREKGKYVNGKRNGCWKSYYKTGRKHSKGTYADGTRVLTWLSWTRSGQRAEEKFGGEALHGRCALVL